MRTSPALGGATSTISRLKGSLADHATAARHWIGCCQHINHMTFVRNVLIHYKQYHDCLDLRHGLSRPELKARRSMTQLTFPAVSDMVPSWKTDKNGLFSPGSRTNGVFWSQFSPRWGMVTSRRFQNVPGRSTRHFFLTGGWEGKKKTKTANAICGNVVNTKVLFISSLFLTRKVVFSKEKFRRFFTRSFPFVWIQRFTRYLMSV